MTQGLTVWMRFKVWKVLQNSDCGLKLAILAEVIVRVGDFLVHSERCCTARANKFFIALHCDFCKSVCILQICLPGASRGSSDLKHDQNCVLVVF